jgi:hypothetical protein
LWFSMVFVASTRIVPSGKLQLLPSKSLLTLHDYTVISFIYCNIKAYSSTGSVEVWLKNFNTQTSHSVILPDT